MVRRKKKPETEQRPAKPGTLTLDSKITAIETVAGRVEIVVRWILTGAREKEIVEAIEAHWPDADMRPLITAAVDDLIKAGEFDGTIVRGWCVEATKQLYRQMAEIGDFAGALRAVQLLWNMSKVQG